MIRGWLQRVGITAVGLLTAEIAGAVELRNDGFANTGAVGFQAGFVVGEIGVARLTPGPGTWAVTHARFLFGGATGMRTVTLHVYEDGTGPTPGSELYTAEYDLTASDSAMQELMSDPPAIVSGPFRVGVEFHTRGLPSIARDSDFTVSQADNFMFAIPGGWVTSFPPVFGDWIIRAEVVSVSGGNSSLSSSSASSSSGGAGASSSAAASSSAVSAAVSSVAASSSSSSSSPSTSSSGTTGDAGATPMCTTNANCPVGEYCDNGSCTSDCQSDAECGTGEQCNSLGRCVSAGGGSTSGGGGDSGAKGCECSTTPTAGWSLGVWMFWVGMAWLGRKHRFSRP